MLLIFFGNQNPPQKKLAAFLPPTIQSKISQLYIIRQKYQWFTVINNNLDDWRLPEKTPEKLLLGTSSLSSSKTSDSFFFYDGLKILKDCATISFWTLFFALKVRSAEIVEVCSYVGFFFIFKLPFPRNYQLNFLHPALNQLLHFQNKQSLIKLCVTWCCELVPSQCPNWPTTFIPSKSFSTFFTWIFFFSSF